MKKIPRKYLNLLVDTRLFGKLAMFEPAMLFHSLPSPPRVLADR